MNTLPNYLSSALAAAARASSSLCRFSISFGMKKIAKSMKITHRPQATVQIDRAHNRVDLTSEQPRAALAAAIADEGYTVAA